MSSYQSEIRGNYAWVAATAEHKSSTCGPAVGELTITVESQSNPNACFQSAQLVVCCRTAVEHGRRMDCLQQPPSATVLLTIKDNPFIIKLADRQKIFCRVCYRQLN